MEQEQERKNKRIGTAVSVAIHALLLILFAFMLAWREPDPPLPEYGIEINFGLADQGSGDVQPQTPVSQEVVEEEEPAPEQPTEEITETETSEPVEEVTEEVVEEVVEEVTQEAPVKNTQESPEVIPEKPVEKPREKTPEKQPEKQPEKKDTPTPTQTPEKSGNEGQGKASAAESSQGDDEDKEGDKGIKEGTINNDAIYKGKQGGGDGGPLLDIVGWMWDEIPDEKDPSNQVGMVTFEFFVDSNGEVAGIRVVKTTVPSSVFNFYRDQLENTTFRQTTSGAPPERTKGTVTFTIVSK